MKKILSHAKTVTLLAAMRAFAVIPGLGKKSKHRASHIHFRREPVKFFGLQGFE